MAELVHLNVFPGVAVCDPHLRSVTRTGEPERVTCQACRESSTWKQWVQRTEEGEASNSPLFEVTLRDLFAGLIAAGVETSGQNADGDYCYRKADELLTARQEHS